MEILECKRLYKYFGEVKAVNGVDFTLKKGQIKALIGPNGAGKTTLVNLISGYLKPDRGKVFFNGKDITGYPPHKISKEGIVRTFQVPRVFMNLSVIDNIRVALISRFNKVLTIHRSLEKMEDITRNAMELLDLVGLKSKAYERTSDLSHGDIKLLDFSIALALDPTILILDEPTSGVGVSERDLIIKTIVNVVRRKGIPTLMIEHDMEVVFNYAEEITVMSEGKIIAEGKPGDVENNPVVQEIVLGGARRNAPA